ncbi:MAG: hypothetical protein ABSG65_22230 [Bryobacteraceae bacterium]
MTWNRIFKSALGLAILTPLASLGETSVAEDRVRKTEQEAVAGTKAVAEEALTRLRGLAGGDRYRLFGFASSEEISQAVLGAGVPVFDIGTEDLKRYSPGSDIAALLIACRQVIYPILVASQVRSSVTIVRMKDAWRFGEYGRALTATALNDAVKSIGNLTGSRAAFIASVPAQSVYLKGKFTAAGIQLRAVQITAEQATTGPDKYLFVEGAPSGTDLIGRLAVRARQQQSSERTLR